MAKSDQTKKKIKEMGYSSNGVSYYDKISDITGALKANSDYSNVKLTSKLMTTDTNGIEALPYQFMESVDTRLDDTKVGRKYADRIFSKMPLLFLTPCEPLFMDDFNKNEKKLIGNVLVNNINLGGDGDLKAALKNQGRYYSMEFNYAEYYSYLNAMLASVAKFMGIEDKKIRMSGKLTAIKNIQWDNELNDDFKSYFSSGENIIFYMDGLDTVSESFSNETTESSLAGIINGVSDSINELNFLFGKEGAAGHITSMGESALSTVSGALSSAGQSLAGGIIGSVLENSPMLKGGKIVFPKIWSNSSYDRSYQIDIKLRSPDHDNLSIFLNILKPYCKILALTLPRNLRDSKGNVINDPNSYMSPFLVKAAAKGMFSVDMGIISSLSVTKGASCCWNDDGLPTQIDMSITIDDLYSSLHMNGFGTKVNPFSVLNFTKSGNISAFVNNTAYMDFLANMAGLNIAQEDAFRKAMMWNYLSGVTLKNNSQANSRRKFNQWVSKLYYKFGWK